MNDDPREPDDDVRHLLATVTPAPPRDLDPADVRRRAGGPGRPRRFRVRHVSVPVLASAAVLVLVAALWSIAAVRAHGVRHDGPVDGGLQRPPTSSTDSTGTARERTIAAADRVLAAMPVVPGTSGVGDGRPYGLGRPPLRPESPDLVDRSLIRAGRGDVATARAYVAAHLPPGIRGSGGAYGGRTTTVTYTPDERWQEPGVFDRLAVLVTYAQVGDRVGIRVDAQAIWLPSRTPSQHVPLSVTGVSIDFVPHADAGRMGAPRVTVERGAATARRLARAIDALPVAPPGTSSCLIAFDDATTMVFHGAGPDRRVVYRVSGCGGVSVGHGPGLRTDGAFLAAYRQAIRGR